LVQVWLIRESKTTGIAGYFADFASKVSAKEKCEVVFSRALRVKDLPADDEGGILWSDPDIAIDRPVKDPIISDRDKRHPHLSDLPDDRLPVTSF